MKKLSAAINWIEETIIVLLLGLMVVITFTQVIARYVFNTGWGSALEITQVLFAWLILFGMSYGIKNGLHLGVDLLIRGLSHRLFKLIALLGALACILYGITFLSAEWITWFGGDSGKGGAWFYWSKMHQLGIGMESITLPTWLFGADERLPRWVAYLMLPIGLALFIFRCTEAFVAILRDKRTMIIASHEAEDLLEKNHTNNNRSSAQ